MKTHLSFLAILLASVAACDQPLPETTNFVIKQGEHYSTPRMIRQLEGNELRFKAKFDESAVYYFENTAEQDSKNKLLGFSDCNSAHHDNSARFAWQWNNERLEIYAYCYVDSARVEKFVGVVEPGETVMYSISMEPDAYRFQVEQAEPVYIERGDVCQDGLNYMLWPYFGGVNPAPHEVRIEIEFL